MKLTLLFAALLSLPVVLMAEAGGAASATSSDAATTSENAAKPSQHPWRRALRHRLLEKFDADHNGQLSHGERDTAKATVREKITARRAERFQKLDADGNGQISRAEWDAAAPAPAVSPGSSDSVFGRPRLGGGLHERLLNRFDADKDGRLSPAERAEARAAIRSHLRP